MAHLQLDSNGQPLREIFSGNILWDDTHFCPVTSLSAYEIEYFRVVPLLETAPPPYNKNTQSCSRQGVEYDPVQGWRYKWVISPLSAEEIASKLAEAKTVKTAQINEWRFKANMSTFVHAGKVIACDSLSRSDIDAVAGSISLTGAFPSGFPGAWKAVDNTYIPLPDIASFKAMYASMTQQGTANFARSQALKATLASATTVEQVEAITW